MDRGDPERLFQRRAPHGTFLIPLSVLQEAGPGGVVLRMRPGLFGDAGDTGRIDSAVDGVPRVSGPACALGRQLPCAALFVTHRPVPCPHAGPGPAPRCL